MSLRIETPFPTSEADKYNLAVWCLTLGVNGIKSRKGAIEWLVRYTLYTTLYPTFSSGPKYALGELLDLIGMTTNVNPEPLGSWQKRIVKDWHNKTTRTLAKLESTNML